MGHFGLFAAFVIVAVIASIIYQSVVKPKGPKYRKPNQTPPENGRPAGQLAVRLGCSVDSLAAMPIVYREFTLPKRSGGKRRILAPETDLKKIQRTILNRLLNKLKVHPAATGFEKNTSIVTNAFMHVGAEVVVKMDIRDFFTFTKDDRIRGYFYGIGWDKESTDLLIRLCTHKRALPQGAPTSPRLSNLVNFELDARLDGWAKKVGAVYTRYADDITFSFAELNRAVTLQGQNPKTLETIPYTLEGKKIVAATIRMTKNVLAEYGYLLHSKRKLNIRYCHQQQRVTGLVVNNTVALPRKTRRWLRSVEHHLASGKPATLTPPQLAGWKNFQAMIDAQRDKLARE